MSLVATLLVLTDAAHFNGGTISWQPVDPTDKVSPISIMITQSYTWAYPNVYCNNSMITNHIPIPARIPNTFLNVSAIYTKTGGYSAVPVTPYCTSFSSSLGVLSSQQSDIVNLTVNASFSITFQNSYWATLTNPSGTNTATWSIATMINLFVRPDGRINTSPVSQMLSPQHIQQNVLTTIVIPTFDSDNDVVRCRWANKSLNGDECANVCPPTVLPAGTILSSNCTLYIKGTTSPALYVAAVMATVVYTTMLYVHNFCGNTVTILDIGLQAPAGIIHGPLTSVYGSNTSLYSMNLTWTPTNQQTGTQLLCAVALDR
ncbi:unnamed protein product [Didymodactylos carnosus]|uniref:Uncharacterized protein n=1 Tax=Didymodactylos carnosus TaxID=1234261 RepID=A0A815KZY1_9BILA|nr:unnamed protein product [Didymodactylos carnosus]CAF4293925.1 unnamed protein product [Didymodactylos carnosus]